MSFVLWTFGLVFGGCTTFEMIPMLIPSPYCTILQLEWKNPDIDGLVQFLVTEKGFRCDLSSACHLPPSPYPLSSEERVRKGAEKLQKFLNSKQQGRLDGFFTVKPKEKADDGNVKGKGKGKGKGDTNTKGKGTKRKVSFFCVLWSWNGFVICFDLCVGR
jgi:flap endonuclease-1